MSQTHLSIADAISESDRLSNSVTVQISNELIRLLSEQLYQSPLKAIEELVVNAYDAEATECRVFVPDTKHDQVVLVFDDGIGMDETGLANLWQIGRSNKREKDVEAARRRKQIGKFGIGKLAAYTVANQLTHITKTKHDGRILSVTVDFSRFSGSATGSTEPMELPVYHIPQWKEFVEQTQLDALLRQAGIDFTRLETDPSWTLAILDNLKEKAQTMKQASLTWVLSTAMPLGTDFKIFLNGEEVKSSKEQLKRVARFDLGDLPTKRIESLKKELNGGWDISGTRLVSDAFKTGVTAEVEVTERSLLGQKSDDIQRSHGFFIRVRGRLVNETDPLFGLKPLYHGVFNRFRADVSADDLDDTLKASRETTEETDAKAYFRALLREIFNEAWTRYNDYENNKEKKAKEGEKEIVSPRDVEYPLADALVLQKTDQTGSEADNSAFYLEIAQDTDLDELITSLYTNPRGKFRYSYVEPNRTDRLVSFDVKTSTFWLNEKHEIVQEYADNATARRLLEDFATADVLLEAYMRISHIPAHVIGAILEQRDKLLRSLAKDHSYSFKAIARSLRDAESDENELEINLVVAARALGFVATHISGSGEPDGLARFNDYESGEKVITLEAKSSRNTPTLAQLDFAGLAEHVNKHNAAGCLLVAPSYPGSTDDSAVSKRARENKISCWTVSQLADFVEAAEIRHFNAGHLLDIVLKQFSPNEVTKAVTELLSQPTWTNAGLYQAILDTLKDTEKVALKSPRSVDFLLGSIALKNGFEGVEATDIERAAQELAHSSQGGMTLRGGKIIIHVALDELERRVSGLIGSSTKSRRQSNFREDK